MTESDTMIEPNSYAQAAGFADDVIGILETDGWCQRAMRDNKGRRCMLGAMGEASWKVLFPTVFLDAVHELIGPSSISVWNDAYGRTKEEVLTVLRQARDNLRAKAAA